MNSKEYMEEADRLRRRIRRKENEIRFLRESAEGMSGSSNSDMPKTVSPDPHKMEIAVEKILTLEKEVEEIRTELHTLTMEMQKQIQKIADEDARDLLTKRYLEFKPWKVVAFEIGYSESHTKRMHSILVKKLILDNTP
ncbi:MAG: hypothetical protein SO054_09765 [Ruminococcus callidus]|nr:hypothetical protein [Ruminococcus callidus]